MKTQTFEHLVGKTGRIYVARGGTVSVYVLSDGQTWLHNNTGTTNAIFSDPAPGFWSNSCEEGAKYQYQTLQITRDSENKPIYPSSTTPTRSL